MQRMKRFGRNETGKDYAVGDIHGCFEKLQCCLNQFFDPAKDRLFAVGDLVDRGPESHAADQYLQLPWFHSVKGNHDDMAERWPLGNMERDIYAMNGGVWNIGRTHAEQRATADLMSMLPLAIEVETSSGIVGLVHAECPFPSWSQFRNALEAFDSLNRAQREAIENLSMWNRDRIKGRNEDPVPDVRAVICGHTPVSEPVVLGNVHYIDTGAVYGHRFTFLDLETLRCFRFPIN
ncbi:metallophosphoesterase [Herbaspirillum robiniae]|uniref:metallophosphoesterase n=1 Tax=Herbaspirillum robiniae TaxID=2014887 RepID=UPI0009A20C2A|nr:metallophosphoesterase [Herbaspirillum robiniae]